MRSDETNWVNTTATYPGATTVNQILYSNPADTVTGLATAANSVLVTDGAGVPSIGADIPTAVTIGGSYIYRAGGTDVPVADGGTGVDGALTGMVKGGNPMTGVTGTADYAARWIDANTGEQGRHHVDETVIQKSVKEAVR